MTAMGRQLTSTSVGLRQLRSSDQRTIGRRWTTTDAGGNNAMTLAIVSTSDRPDLALTTGTWRWEAFYKDGGTELSEVLEGEAVAASSPDLLPTVLVLLEDDLPVGMVAICLDDLDGRPELNPWLAGLYVEPNHRGKGHALRLMSELETLARRSDIERLTLYTASAVSLYEKTGWRTIETFDDKGEEFHIMSKNLAD
ncbi:GNAT family N-acetyltransferase [Sinorhizobium meliloti]|nr:GNAT family N-acetyltransferase [Sinorhizobium meliloti]